MVTGSQSAWAQWWDHVSSIGDGYGRSHESQELEPQVSVKKESLQQLKVRTDLKGGIAVSCGGVLYQDASLRRIQFRRGSDQSRHGGSLSRGGHSISEPTRPWYGAPRGLRAF